MKVERKKFLESVNYIKKVNACNLEDLDLSEFFSEDFSAVEGAHKLNGEAVAISANLAKLIEQWSFMGLDNRDFILHHYGNGEFNEDEKYIEEQN